MHFQDNRLGALIFAIAVLSGCGFTPLPDQQPANPVPTLSSVSPSSAEAGADPISITLAGSRFVSSSTVTWNGQSRPTTFHDSSHLSATVASVDLAKEAVASVAVFTPVPGGGTSAPVSFSVLPAPKIGVMSRLNIAEVSDGTTLELIDSGNVSGDAGAMSATGRYVTFSATKKIYTSPDVYVRDTCLNVAACTPSTTLVSVDLNGTSATEMSVSPTIDASGRYIAFESNVRNLVPTTNSFTAIPQIYIRDTCVGADASCKPATALISVSAAGVAANNHNYKALISSDARFVSFRSAASNLDSHDQSAAQNVYLRDTCIGAPSGCSTSTTVVDLTNTGTFFHSHDDVFGMSASGRHVLFAATSDPLPGEFFGTPGSYVRDTCAATSECMPQTYFIALEDGHSMTPDDLSSDGRYVLGTRFGELKTVDQLIVPGCALTSRCASMLYVRDTCLGAPTECRPSTKAAWLTADGNLPDGHFFGGSLLSGDGRFVAFVSDGTNIAPWLPTDTPAVVPFGMTFGINQVYVRDTCIGAPSGCQQTTRRVSVTPDGVSANGGCSVASISSDGKYVTFWSTATNLLPGVTKGSNLYLSRSR